MDSMVVNSCKDKIVKYLEGLIFEEFNEKEIQKNVLDILGLKGPDHPICVDFDGKTLEVLVGHLTFYVKKVQNEKESL